MNVDFWEAASAFVDGLRDELRRMYKLDEDAAETAATEDEPSAPSESPESGEPTRSGEPASKGSESKSDSDPRARRRDRRRGKPGARPSGVFWSASYADAVYDNGPAAGSSDRPAGGYESAANVEPPVDLSSDDADLFDADHEFVEPPPDLGADAGADVDPSVEPPADLAADTTSHPGEPDDEFVVSPAELAEDVIAPPPDRGAYGVDLNADVVAPPDVEADRAEFEEARAAAAGEDTQGGSHEIRREIEAVRAELDATVEANRRLENAVRDLLRRVEALESTKPTADMPPSGGLHVVRAEPPDSRTQSSENGPSVEAMHDSQPPVGAAEDPVGARPTTTMNFQIQTAHIVGGPAP